MNMTSEGTTLTEENTIRELIYLDVNKTASLFSQLRGGLPKEIQETYAKGEEGGAGLTAPIFSIGLKHNKSESTTEIINMHHDMLVAAENALASEGRLIDLMAERENKRLTADQIREEIKQTPYVRIEGKSEFRDFEMVKRLMGAVAKGQSKNSLGKKGKRRNSSNQSNPMTQSELIDQFVPNRIHFAVQPFPGFIAYSNLRAECILDRDADNVLFHYGTKPNVELTVFGVVASAPLPKADAASLFSYGETVAGDPLSEQFAQAFDQIFEVIRPLEKIENFANYPNITVYPYAIYRKIRT